MTLNEYQQNSCLKIYEWGGRPGFNQNGYLITNDGQVIKFNQGFTIKSNFKEKEENTDVVAKMSPEGLSAFKKYLIDEEKIFTTEYQQPRIFDIGNTIEINIDGQKRKIENSSKNYLHSNKDEIFNKLSEEIKDIISLWGNNES